MYVNGKWKKKNEKLVVAGNWLCVINVNRRELALIQEREKLPGNEADMVNWWTFHHALLSGIEWMNMKNQTTTVHGHILKGLFSCRKDYELASDHWLNCCKIVIYRQFSTEITFSEECWRVICEKWITWIKINVLAISIKIIDSMRKFLLWAKI